MISFHSWMKVCGSRILKSVISVIAAAKRYNLLSTCDAVEYESRQSYNQWRNLLAVGQS